MRQNLLLLRQKRRLQIPARRYSRRLQLQLHRLMVQHQSTSPHRSRGGDGKQQLQSLF
jgi:hypothetical protein